MKKGQEYKWNEISSVNKDGEERVQRKVDRARLLICLWCPRSMGEKIRCPRMANCFAVAIPSCGLAWILIHCRCQRILPLFLFWQSFLRCPTPKAQSFPVCWLKNCPWHHGYRQQWRSAAWISSSHWHYDIRPLSLDFPPQISIVHRLPVFFHPSLSNGMAQKQHASPTSKTLPTTSCFPHLVILTLNSQAEDRSFVWVIYRLLLLLLFIYLFIFCIFMIFSGELQQGKAERIDWKWLRTKKKKKYLNKLKNKANVNGE